MHSNVFYVKCSNHSPNSKNYFCYNSIWHIFQNLQDTSIPEINTRLDQHVNIIFTCTYKFWRPCYCYQNWDIHSLANCYCYCYSNSSSNFKIVTLFSTITFKYVWLLFIWMFDLLVTKSTDEIYIICWNSFFWMKSSIV